MIRPGFVIENSITGSRITVLETDAETQGRGWLLEHRSPPHAAPDIPEHLHLTWTETFEIVSGIACYQLKRVTNTATAGETIIMPPSQPHIHPWNVGETELVYRQRDDFGVVNPEAVQAVLGVFATAAGLTRDGKGDQRGQPRNPLQLAVTLKLLSQYGTYDATAPIAVQKLIAATLGTLGEALGYKAVNPKYLE